MSQESVTPELPDADLGIPPVDPEKISTEKSPKEEAYITIGTLSADAPVEEPYEEPDWFITQCPDTSVDEIIIGDVVVEYLEKVKNWSHIVFDINDRVMAVDANNNVKTGYYVCRKKPVEEPTP